MAKNLKDIVIVSALRTPIGKLKGIWSKHGAPELGAKVILEVLNQSKVPSSDIDEIIMGQVLTGNTGQNPARQAAMMAGIPIEKTAYIINQVCGSGLRAVVAGYQSILSGDCEAVIVGGQESMTNSKEELMLKEPASVPLKL